jgi:hypothetical protein
MSLVCKDRSAAGVRYECAGRIAGLYWSYREIFLPPGGPQVLVRAVLVAAFGVASLLWTTHVTYRGVSLVHIRDKIVQFPLSAAAPVP